MKKTLTTLIATIPLFLFADWNINFNEKTSMLEAVNGNVSIKGKLNFQADIKNGDKWKITNSRDGVKNRMALVDDGDNVQGYVVIPQKSNELEILCYHRTAQAYHGTMSFDGTVNIKDAKDTFACRTKADDNERVFSLNYGNADVKTNDSIFDAQKDELLKMSAKNLCIKTLGNGNYAVKMSGKINESAQANFSFNLQKNYYKNRYVPYYKPLNRVNVPKTPTGWMSWNTYFDQAGAEENLAEARIGQKYLQPFGCEIWSIESWQGNSDKLPTRKFHLMNLEVNERQFPLGMKKLADDIRALGFRPGLWMAPFGTGNTEFYKAHKDWFLHNAKGEPIGSWNGLYTLDPTVPEARKHLENIFRIASREWGYEFFKIDGMSGRNAGYCAHLYDRPSIRSVFKDPKCPNPFELCVKAFRDGIGKDRIFLACQGHTSGPEAAYAEMARTGADIVHPNKPVMWHNVTTQGRCTINQVFTHNISMIADPDTLLVRDLPIEEARTTATIVALPGQLTFFGDRLAELPQERMKMLQQTLPVAFVRPMSLYPYFKMLPVWNLNVKHKELGRYNVVAFMNWEDDDQKISATAKELGICDNTKYHAFEFWTQKYLGEMQGEFSQKVPAHGTRLVVLMPKQKNPQYLGSDRHVAQTAQEIWNINWDSIGNRFTGYVKLVKDFPLTIWVSKPDGFNFESAIAYGAKCKAKVENGAIKITLQKDAKQTDDARIEVQFSRK